MLLLAPSALLFVCLTTVLSQVLPTTPVASPESTITYDALDLMWLDGLDDVRAMIRPAQPTHGPPASTSSVQHEPIPFQWRCSSLEELQWYCKWKGIASDQQTFGDLPLVSTSQLLIQLGVPQQQLQAILAQMAPGSLACLRRAVLPAFKREVVALIAEQLPGLALLSKLDCNQLFAG